MSKKCYLEVYSKHKDLNDKRKVEYWNKYIELIEPILSEFSETSKSISLDFLLEKIKELLPEFKDEIYGLIYEDKIEDDYFVLDNKLCFKHFIPDTFYMPFKKSQEWFSYKEDFNPLLDPLSCCRLKYKTTVREGLFLMEKRVKYLDDSDFKTECNKVIDFLKTMPLDSILILDSGDTCIEDNPKEFLEEISRVEEMFLRMDNENK